MSTLRIHNTTHASNELGQHSTFGPPSQENFKHLYARITELERELDVFEKDRERRVTEQLKKLANAERELHDKQKELDESIVEVMNWVPQAISAAHDDRDRDYKQLRVAKSESFLLRQQLTRAQPSLKGTVDDIVDYPASPPRKPNTTPDINLVLGRELLKAKEAYERDVSALNKKVAHLQVQLAATDKMHSETRSCGTNIDQVELLPISRKVDVACQADLDLTGFLMDHGPHQHTAPVLSYGSNQPTAVEILPQPLPQLESLGFQDFMPSKTNAAVSGKDNNETSPEQFPDGINSVDLTITNCSDKVIVQELPPLQIPAEAANIQWFNHAVQFLNVHLGEPYHKLLLQWMELERKKKWVSSIKHFRAGQRPKELKKWVDNGRYRTTITVLPNDVDRFGKSVWKWWNSLQPAWREIDKKKKRPKPAICTEDDWKALDYSGPNGWLGILACIRWWGEAVSRIDDTSKRDEGIKDWLEAVVDVSLMLDGYISYLTHIEPTVSV